MNVITELVWLIPVIVAFVQAAKLAGLPSRFAGLVALAAGVAASLAVGPDAASGAELAVAGVATGLAAAGLYSAGKATVTG